MSRSYTPFEVAIKVLQKAEDLTKSAMAGLKTAKLTPVPGVISPTQSNTATPTKVGSQAVVKMAKPKKMGQATDKPSVFFKTEEFQQVKKPSIENLRAFLEKQRKKR
jgi:hypothetical protein